MAQLVEKSQSESTAGTSAEAPVQAARASQASSRKPTAAQLRKRTITLHRWVRFAVQIAFFILAPGLFSGAFNGVKYLATQIGAMAPVEGASFLVLLVALLAFTAVFGRFFCGYACAFGTLGDILYAAFEALRARIGVPRVEFPPLLVKVLSLVKYVILLAICVACFLGVWSSVSGFSPWVAFAGFTSGSLEGIEPVAFVLLAIVVVGMIVRERFFCQFLCPMGAVFALMPVLGFSEFTRTRAHCAKSCGRCQACCPVGIWPDADSPGHGECIACARCADVCPMGNVNLVALYKGAEELKGKPQRKTKESWHLLRGSGVGVVVAKALVLLAVCWMLGALRYLPAFPLV